jgi:hypothetical protein
MRPAPPYRQFVALAPAAAMAAARMLKSRQRITFPLLDVQTKKTWPTVAGSPGVWLNRDPG